MEEQEDINDPFRYDARARFDFGSTVLLGEACARLQEILERIGEFNEIRDTLAALGLGDDTSGGPRIPYLSLIGDGNRSVVDWSSIRSVIDHEKIIQPGAIKRYVKPTKRSMLLLERQRLGSENGWRCFYCRQVGDEIVGPDDRVWHVDHAYPLGRGGDDQRDNHVLSCATCNLQKHSRTAMEYIRDVNELTAMDAEEEKQSCAIGFQMPKRRKLTV